MQTMQVIYHHPSQEDIVGLKEGGYKEEVRDGIITFIYGLLRNSCLIKAMDQARMSAWKGTPKATVHALQVLPWAAGISMNLSWGRLIASKIIEFKWERSNRNTWKLRVPAMLNKVQGTCHQDPSLPFWVLFHTNSTRAVFWAIKEQSKCSLVTCSKGVQSRWPGRKGVTGPEHSTVSKTISGLILYQNDTHCRSSAWKPGSFSPTTHIWHYGSLSVELNTWTIENICSRK